MLDLSSQAEREAAARAEEEVYRQRMMAKFAEDDRLEQLNAQKRRLKVHTVWHASHAISPVAGQL